MRCKYWALFVLSLFSVFSLRAQGVDEISPMAIYNVALVGCDSAGSELVKLFVSTGEARCVALFDKDSRMAEQAKAEIESVQSKAPERYDDYMQMLDRRDVDILLLVVPAEQCEEFFLKACEYDKNMYVEIPPAFPSDRLKRLIEASRKMSGAVQAGEFTKRADTTERIKNLLYYLDGRADTLAYPLESLEKR
ncbi:MAG TPA: Gfo/Idh/MocA family oxidoreductase [Candidatus Barnesiella excrementigallinarum]|nr:Gfo/Idh/MocA family oxidoreductase [Candidatus Barnesiella excrementigallinarum]